MPEEDNSLGPWDHLRRRRFMSPFFDLDEIDEDFERMHRYMDALLHNAMSSEPGQCPAGPENRYVYGFTIRMGPDGKPVIQEFGNTRPNTRSPHLSGAREPLIDINECEDSIAITAELPGVEKESVNLTANADSIIIEADSGSVRYYKEIPLPEEVEAEKATATCKNGILDVQMPKKRNPDHQGYRVKVD